VRDALLNSKYLVVVDHLVRPSQALAASIRELMPNCSIPVVAVSRSAHMEDVGFALPLFPERTERVALRNFDPEVAILFAAEYAERESLTAVNLDQFLNRIVEYSGGNPGAMLQMIRMATSGFGVMGWVAALDYSQAQSDPLVEHKSDIMQHMNADHRDALILLAWVRSILEVEDRIPDWLVEILNTRVPGFIETESALSPKAIKRAPDEQSTGARVKHGNVDTDPFVAARAHNIGLLAEITGAQRYQGSLQTDSK